MMNQILIVEDDSIIAMGFQAIIEQTLPYCEVTICDSIAGAMAAITDTHYDMAFLDGEVLDGVTTEGLICAIRAQQPQCRCVAISSKAELVELQRKQGCQFELPKPFNVPYLLDFLAKQFASSPALA